MAKQRAVIVGAGPAGLTVAYELLTRTDIKPVVLEMSSHMGGISRTVVHNGNRIDIGGHRFFSKSDRVMDWWLRFLPLEEGAAGAEITYQRHTRTIDEAAAQATETSSDRVMLLRSRRSRIYFLRRFFDYPISLTPATLRSLGLWRTLRVGLSYLRAMLFPIRRVENLEHFFVNRFGRQLYETFFRSYTEKVWGVPCTEISAEWGAQRIKGLSITSALAHFLKSLLPRRGDHRQKGTETSLIEQFLYPKHGPGQMWETVAEEVLRLGGEIRCGLRVTGLETQDGQVVAVEATDENTGAVCRLAADLVFSTMPVKDLVRGLRPAPPSEIREIAEGLVYRDFITVGLLVSQLRIREDGRRMVRDNWIYIQEPDVLVGRLQLFNNWSPYMVADPETVWLGLEYFCDEGDHLWSRSDESLIALAAEELRRIEILGDDDPLDAVVLRMPKTYPAYFGTYDRFPALRAHLDAIENLYLVGRNGMHRYNNQDHSMLAAMVAVDNLVEGRRDKANVWEVNTEEEYHEEKGDGEQ